MAHFHASTHSGKISLSIGKAERTDKGHTGSYWGQRVHDAFARLTGLTITNSRDKGMHGNTVFTLRRQDGSEFELDGYVNCLGNFSITVPDEELVR
jgi:hypothetical protein